MTKSIKFSMYFGRAIKDGRTVTRMMFKNFCQFYVDTRLDCYTLESCRGVWKGTHERTFKLTVTVDAGASEYHTGHMLADIATCYNKQFDQECVMIEKHPVDMWFVS